MIVKRPSVSMFMGSVMNTRIGLTNILRIPKVRATSTADVRPVTITPGTRYEVRRTANEFSSKIIKMFILF
jgi:hypothetical protein